MLMEWKIKTYGHLKDAEKGFDKTQYSYITKVKGNYLYIIKGIYEKTNS